MTITDAAGNVLAAGDLVGLSTSAVFAVKGLRTGHYPSYCSLHRDEGMVGTLEVR